MLLMTRPRCAATTSAQRASNSSTRSPIRSSESSLDSAVKLTMSAKPTVSSVVCRSSSRAPSAADAGDRGGEVTPPDVDEQVLERRADLLDHPHRRLGRSGSPAGLRCSRSSSSTRWSSAETSQSESRAIVWPTARVRLTARSKSSSPVSTSPISVESARRRPGERDRSAVLGEAERAPQPLGLLDGRRRSPRRPRAR